MGMEGRWRRAALEVVVGEGSSDGVSDEVEFSISGCVCVFLGWGERGLCFVTQFYGGGDVFMF